MQSELVISLFFSLFLFWLPLQKLIFPLDSKQKKDNELKDTLRSSWLWVKHYENIQKARSYFKLIKEWIYKPLLKQVNKPSRMLIKIHH